MKTCEEAGVENAPWNLDAFIDNEGQAWFMAEDIARHARVKPDHKVYQHAAKEEVCLIKTKRHGLRVFVTAEAVYNFFKDLPDDHHSRLLEYGPRNLVYDIEDWCLDNDLKFF
ncbi:hypothetical protein [Devriesea agamarum]|uniref:hypothetical protein n=1 Tax=Devriesea agamarum TaxID=472569 RepID=UPI00071C68A1|nr:hypothetical protein [Devriesea agamarum]